MFVENSQLVKNIFQAVYLLITFLNSFGFRYNNTHGEILLIFEPIYEWIQFFSDSFSSNYSISIHNFLDYEILHPFKPNKRTFFHFTWVRSSGFTICYFKTLLGMLAESRCLPPPLIFRPFISTVSDGSWDLVVKESSRCFVTPSRSRVYSETIVLGLLA